MSAIPTKQIDGDVAVGRNISIGGRANIQGSVRIGHNLKVEGWLEAPNIKGVNKGLFATFEDLSATYPKPEAGWFAGVSATQEDIEALGITEREGVALFRMYVGIRDTWVCEPLDKLYEIVVDDNRVSLLDDELTQLKGVVEILEDKVETAENAIETNRERIVANEAATSSAAAGAAAAMTEAEGARAIADRADETSQANATAIAHHTEQIEELYADSASQQANIADHASKLTELYEATGSLWANIDDLKGVDALHTSQIAELETGSTNLAAAIQAVRETAEGAQTSANANAAAIDSLLGANASTAIENFNEIIQFLDGIKDDEQLIGFLNELKTADSETASLIATHTTQIEALQSTAAEHDQQLAELATDAAAQRVCNEEHDTRISSLEERQSDCVWVLPFAFIFDSSPTEGSTVDFSLATAPSESEIVFDLATNCFYAYTSALSMVDGAPQAIHTLYMKWEGCERYQRDGEPRRDCIYVSEENRLYRFDGATFALVGSSLEIGTVSGTAFDGARGEALESAIGALTTQVADNTSQVADHATQLSQQFAKLGEIETAADAMQTAIESLQGVDIEHQQQINEALRDIDTVKGNVNGHDTRITALEGMQNDIAEIRQLVQETKTLAEQVLGAAQGYNHEWIEAQ